MSILKYLIAGGLGFGVAKLLGNKKEKDYDTKRKVCKTVYEKQMHY